MAFTTLPTLLAGDEILSTDIDAIFAAIAELRPLAARKTADQPNSTTTIADDTELQITVLAGHTYEGYANLIVNTSTAGDFKLQWSSPTGTTGWWNPITPPAAGTIPYTGALDITAQAQQEGSASDIFCRATFQFVTTTAGIFKAQHALNAASGTLTVKSNSILVARMIT